MGTTVVEARDYDAWGVALAGRSYVSGAPAKEAFTSKERDAETGLDYFGARYYVAALGRWTSVGPLADEVPAYSPYNYALNNPLSLTDPTGMAPEIVKTSDCPPDCPDSDSGGSRAFAACAAVAISVLAADDAKVIGIVDDVLIPVVAGIAVVANEARV